MKKTKFKMTEIGPIPEDWEVKRLGELFAFKNGYNADARNYGRGIPVASVLEALSDRPLTVDQIRGKVDACRKDQDLFSLKRDDLIFTRSSEILEDVGRSNVYEDDSRAMFGGFVIRGRPKTKNDSRFINYLLKDSSHRDRIIAKGAGAQHYNIGQNGLAKVFISLPPLPEQKAIAEVLSDVDELLAAMRTLIEKKRAIKQGAMQELLGIRNEGEGMGIRNEELGMRNCVPRRRLPGFSGKWKIVRIGEISKLVNGYAFKSETYTDDGQFSIITIANVQDGKFILESVNKINKLPDDIQSHQILHKGDIIISMTGNVGRVCRVTQEKCLLNQRVGKFESIEIDTSFFYSSLRSKRFISTMIEKGQGGAQPNIGKYDISSYELKVPPTVAEQRAIAEVLSDMDAEIEALEAKRAKYESIKQGMMQELLTGKTRLV